MTAGERAQVPLYLCCAEDNEIALVQVVDALHREGKAPEILAGVDGDGMLLSHAVDRSDGPALFVLCQTEQLDRSHLRRLEGLFSARKGPHQRIVTVRLNSARPLDALPEIRRVLEAMSGVAGRARNDDAERPLFRDVVGPTKVSAVKRSSADHEELAKLLHQEMVAAEALLSRRDADTSPPRLEIPEPTVDEGVEPGAPREELPDEGARSLDARLDASLPNLPELGEDIEPTEQLAAPDQPEEPEEPEDDGVAVRSGVEITHDSQDSDDEEQEVTGPTPGRGIEREEGPAPAMARVDRPANRFLLVSGVVGLAVLGVMAVFFLGDDPPPPRAPGVRATHDSGAANVASPPTPAPDRRPDAETPPRRPTHPVPPPPARLEPEAQPQEPIDPEPSDPAKSEASTPVPKPNQEKPRVEPEPEPKPTPPATPEPTADPLERAIAQGAVEAVGRLLMVDGASDTQTWTTATKTCRSKRVEGVGGWRLPTTAQLQRLSSAGAIDKATYWTREQGETEDEAYAVDTGSGARNLYLTVEPIARTVCVRGRR